MTSTLFKCTSRVGPHFVRTHPRRASAVLSCERGEIGLQVASCGELFLEIQHGLLVLDQDVRGGSCAIVRQEGAVDSVQEEGCQRGNIHPISSRCRRCFSWRIDLNSFLGERNTCTQPRQRRCGRDERGQGDGLILGCHSPQRCSRDARLCCHSDTAPTRRPDGCRLEAQCGSVRESHD